MMPVTPLVTRSKVTVPVGAVFSGTYWLMRVLSR